MRLCGCSIDHVDRDWMRRVRLVTTAAAGAVAAAAALFAGASAHAQPPVVAVKASAGQFSPNGDGRHDRVAAAVTVSEPATLDVQVLDSTGLAVVSLASAMPVRAGMTPLAWDGKAATGKRVQ